MVGIIGTSDIVTENKKEKKMVGIIGTSDIVTEKRKKKKRVKLRKVFVSSAEYIYCVCSAVVGLG